LRFEDFASTLDSIFNASSSGLDLPRTSFSIPLSLFGFSVQALFSSLQFLRQRVPLLLTFDPRVNQSLDTSCSTVHLDSTFIAARFSNTSNNLHDLP